MDARRARHLIEFAVFSTIVFVVRCLPIGVSERLASGMGSFVHSVIPRRLNRHAVAAKNIRTALGAELSDDRVDGIVLGMWQHLFHMGCEVAQLSRRFRLYSCRDSLEFRGGEHCVRAVLQRRPILFLSGHFGNWEISVATFGHFGFPMGVVARDLDNPYLHDWFLKFRESSGNWLISKQGAGSQLSELLSDGGMAAMLCDQDAGPNGVFADFFGTPASTFKSLALLALQHDAIIVVGGAWRLPKQSRQQAKWTRFEMATVDVIDSREFTDNDAIRQITERYTKSLEQLVRRAPEQYFWVHRRWKTPVSQSREFRRRNRRAA